MDSKSLCDIYLDDKLMKGHFNAKCYGFHVDYFNHIRSDASLKHNCSSFNFIPFLTKLRPHDL